MEEETVTEHIDDQPEIGKVRLRRLPGCEVASFTIDGQHVAPDADGCIEVDHKHAADIRAHGFEDAPPVVSVSDEKKGDDEKGDDQPPPEPKSKGKKKSEAKED